MDKIDAIIEIIRNYWDDEELITAWNLMCEEKGNMDEYIECMSSFNEIFADKKPLDAIEMVRGCNFGTMDDYFAFNRYGNIESFSDVSDYSCFDYGCVAEYLMKHGDSETATVEVEEMITYFVDEYFNYSDEDEMRALVEEYIEKESYDLLTTDWDLLAEEIKENIEDDEE